MNDTMKDDCSTPAALLKHFLDRRLPEDAREWLDDKCQTVASSTEDRPLFTSIALAPRKVGKGDLAANEQELRDADSLRTGWCPRQWSLDQAARVLLLLESTKSGCEFAPRFDSLCRTADVGELVAFYRGLPVYPQPEALLDRAVEGLRTNMKAVFEAVAHDNPYPRERFEQGAWNQMILKALFIGTSLGPVQGLEERANAPLTEMLCDYARERRAAHRTIRPDLWRCVGSAPTDASMEDLEIALQSAEDSERRGACLALVRCSHPRAEKLLEKAPDLEVGARAGHFDWGTLAS